MQLHDGRRESKAINETKLFLLSGLGADEKIFIPQRLRFDNLRVLDWQEPLPNESLEDYCLRFAHSLELEVPCIIGGASFGGIVAMEMSKHLPATMCILIGSLPGPAELPLWIRSLRPLHWLVPLLPIRLLQVFAAFSAWLSNRLEAKFFASILSQFADASPSLVAWSLKQILNWRDSAEPSIPIRHIHGALDRVFPIRYLKPDITVPDGGHLISLTHGREVNAALEVWLSESRDRDA